MASLKASSSGALARGLKNGKATANCISSLRVKPFTTLGRSPAASKQPSVFLLRAAEAEVEAAPEVEGAPVAVEVDDYEFNMNDAKKNNEYEDSDVEAALRYYYEGAAPPSANEDFVSNMFGGEDASFFDDIDNEDDGDWDEYAVAGIPEAAPKKGQGAGRGEEGAAEGEEDGAAQGQKLAMLQAIEDQMVLDADMEDVYGTQGGSATAGAQSDLTSADNAVWGWLGGNSEAAEVVDVEQTVPSSRHSNVVLPSDDEVFSAFSALKVDELDEQTRDMLELIIGDDPSDLDLAEDSSAVVDSEVPEETEVFSAEELNNMDLLAEHPDTDLSEFEDLLQEPEPTVAVEEDAGEVVSQKSFDAYLASLNQAAQAAADASDADLSMTYDQVTDMFSRNDVAVREDEDTGPALNMDNLFAAEAKIPQKAQLDVDMDFGTNEIGDAEISEIREELLSMGAIEQFTEEDMPSEQQLEILDQYLAAVEDIDAQEQQVEDTVTDLETEYAEDLIADLAEAEENPVDVVGYDVEEEEDGETWLERVIELTRVTKVTKGGKVIGFRCTAVVGNQNGLVGVGCQSGIEIGIATKRALVDAKRNVVKVSLVGAGTIPHKSQAKFHAAKCILVPASDGTGVIAGGSIKAVLELAGVQNVLAKRLGCRSLLNNARCTIKALTQLRTLYDVAKARGVGMDHLLLPVDV